MGNWDLSSKKSRIMADIGHMRAGKRSDRSYFDFKASGWEFVTSFSFCKKCGTISILALGPRP